MIYVDNIIIVQSPLVISSQCYQQLFVLYCSDWISIHIYGLFIIRSLAQAKMGACTNESRKNPEANDKGPDQNARAKEKGTEIFGTISNSLFDTLVKDKLPQRVQKGVSAVQAGKKAYDDIQNIAEIAQGPNKKAPTVIKPPIDKNVQQIRKLALKEGQIEKNKSEIKVQQLPVSAVAQNPQSKIQNLPNDKGIQPQSKSIKENEGASWYQYQTPSIAMPVNGVMQSNLSNLQQKLKNQPSLLKKSSIPQKQADNSMMNAQKSKVESILYQSFLREQINPELSNHVLQSKLASFIVNEDMIAEQGNGPIKGAQVKLSAVRLF